MFTVFNTEKNNTLKEPMFFGQNVNVARYDQQKHPFFERLTQKQLGFFWRPEEIDLSRDAIDFREALTPAEQHIFTSNLKYQTLLDSVQGRSPNIALLPLVSLPELETWIETWAFSETIHSRSYTHIVRNLYADPSVVFDGIVDNQHIQARALSVTEHYDRLINLVALRTAGLPVDQHDLEDALFLTMVSVNALEAVRFYVSFACAFAFAERKLMVGNAAIIKLIARDEALHLSGTQQILRMWIDGEDDPRMQAAATRNLGQIEAIFRATAEQEMQWADYLFSNGSMLGLNAVILHDYVRYITDVRVKALGLAPIYGVTSNPIPWINSYLSSSNYQPAPQEQEITSYLTGQVDSAVTSQDLADFTL